ncbi:MAG TPA: hypothetical protein VE709_07205 [Pseudonocardiaceae bacterium]|nr:hypothetical protein [Pseudonocardiaceae bacterium]
MKRNESGSYVTSGKPLDTGIELREGASLFVVLYAVGEHPDERQRWRSHPWKHLVLSGRPAACPKRPLGAVC